MAQRAERKRNVKKFQGAENEPRRCGKDAVGAPSGPLVAGNRRRSGFDSRSNLQVCPHGRNRSHVVREAWAGRVLLARQEAWHLSWRGGRLESWPPNTKRGRTILQ